MGKINIEHFEGQSFPRHLQLRPPSVHLNRKEISSRRYNLERHRPIFEPSKCKRMAGNEPVNALLCRRLCDRMEALIKSALVSTQDMRDPLAQFERLTGRASA
jgi:hypothetical protein